MNSMMLCRSKWNIDWFMLQFYRFLNCFPLFRYRLHRGPVPFEGSMDENYENMVQKEARWFSDGHIDNNKNIQLSLSSHLPLSNEMTFVLVFSM